MWCTERYLYNLPSDRVLWCLCTALTNTKIKVLWKSRDVILWNRVARTRLHSATLLKKNDIWLVQVRIEAEADKQMDLLCRECSLGEPDGPRYRHAAFVSEPAWSIIRPFGEWTKRGVIATQRHTCSYTQSISLSLCLSIRLSPSHRSSSPTPP